MRVVLLVLLVASVPFVHADELKISMLSGKDRVFGFTKGTDTLVLEVLASIDRDVAVTPEQVLVDVQGAKVFPSSCVPQAGQFLCSYSEPVVDRVKPVSYKVSLKDDGGAVVKEIGDVLVVDNKAPSVTLFVSPEISKGVGQLRFVVDDGVECSGLKSVKAFVEESREVIAERTFPVETCVTDEVLAFELKASKGRLNVCVSATDALGHEGEGCVPFVVDNAPPAVRTVSVYSNRTPLSSIAPEGGVFSLGVTVDDVSGVSPSGVVVRVDKLTGSAGDVRSADRVVDSVFFVDNIRVAAGSVCAGKVTVKDSAGNSAEKDFSCKLGVDAEGPDPVSITTGLKGVDGELLVGPEGAITATIRENDVLDPAKVFMNLLGVTGESQRRAEKCEKKEGQLWECVWGPLTVTGKPGPKVVELLDVSTDGLGNRFQRGLKAEVEVTDLVVSISDILHAPKFVPATEAVTFSFFVTPAEIQPRVVLNTTPFTLSGGLREANCEKGAGKWQCSLTVTNLKPTKAPVPVQFFLSDESGNNFATTYALDVFEVEVGSGDFFTLVGLGLQPPSGVDRRAATQIPYPVAVQPFFQSKDPLVSVASVAVVCNETNLIVPAQVLSPQSKQPLILLKFNPAVSDINTSDFLKVNCIVKILAKKDRTIFTTPEVKNFTAKVPLYNLPLGSIDKTIQAKIDSANVYKESIEDKIKQYKKVNQVLGAMAGIGTTIAQVDAVWSIVTAAIWLVAFIAKQTGILAGLAVSMWQSSCWVYDIFHSYTIIPGVWAPGWPIPLGSNPLPKMAALINSCQMCRHTGVYDIQLSGIAGDLVVDVDAAKGAKTTVQNLQQYLWEPHKSIHVAALCLCPAGIEYNLRKERQIACIYRNCLREHAKLGLPMANCDRTLIEQNCLYVDSAGWKIAGSGGMVRIFGRLSILFLEKIPEMALGAVWTGLCYPFLPQQIVIRETACLSPVGTAPLFVGCAVLSVPSMLQETEFFSGNRFNFNQYGSTLEGDDYCGD
ncbi:hypothetical protein HY490_00085 [Candidatus Woesearchaeota archaeon]|nr:hypothetical protein [Candidatus Woesearchaeota archaeon]